MTERTSTRAFGSEICTAQLLTEEKSSLIPRLRLEWCCLRASIFTCHKQLSNSDRAKDFTLDIFHTCGSQELYTFAFSKSVVREVDNSSHEAESKAFINLCSCYLVCEVNFQETRGIFRIPHDPGSPLWARHMSRVSDHFRLYLLFGRWQRPSTHVAFVSSLKIPVDTSNLKWRVLMSISGLNRDDWRVCIVLIISLFKVHYLRVGKCVTKNRDGALRKAQVQRSLSVSQHICCRVK